MPVTDPTAWIDVCKSCFRVLDYHEQQDAELWVAVEQDMRLVQPHLFEPGAVLCRGCNHVTMKCKHCGCGLHMLMDGTAGHPQECTGYDPLPGKLDPHKYTIQDDT